MKTIDVIKTELACVQRDCCRVENQCANCDLVLPVEEIIKAYITCIKLLESENQWHDLRKDPNDLPEDTYDVLDQAGYKVHYNFFQNVWVNEKDEIDEHVIAWCEIPKFEE